MSANKSFSVFLRAFSVMLALAACSAPPTSTGEFKIAVIVDTTSDPVSRVQAEAVITIASEKMIALTGFGLQLIDFVDDDSGGSIESLVENYMENRSTLPNGILVFSVGDDDQAKINRAYARQYQGPNGFRNAFASPYREDGTMYVAILQFNYRYAACGYAGTDTIQSPFSIGDECPGGTGQACAEWEGIQVCPSALPFLEGHTPIDMAAGPVIHEFMHAFGNRRGGDHYGSDECNKAMGWPIDYFDFDESETYNGFCPDAYDVFIDSYRP
jgi:hypothetical protein